MMIDPVDFYIALRWYLLPLCLILSLCGMLDELIERSPAAQQIVDKLIEKMSKG